MTFGTFDRNAVDLSAARTGSASILAKFRQMPSTLIFATFAGLGRRPHSEPITANPRVHFAPPAFYASLNTTRLYVPFLNLRMLKSKDRLDHRNPAGHSRGVRTKCSAVRSSLNSHHLAGHPQTLGWQKIPLDSSSILVRVGKLSEDF